jgi:hypothetical protein
MVRAFRKYAVPEFSSHGTMRDASVWEWLTVAQVSEAKSALRCSCDASADKAVRVCGRAAPRAADAAAGARARRRMHKTAVFACSADCCCWCVGLNCRFCALQDWTHNPMIAAHFVTDRPEDLATDGAIWRVLCALCSNVPRKRLTHQRCCVSVAVPQVRGPLRAQRALRGVPPLEPSAAAGRQGTLHTIQHLCQ